MGTHSILQGGGRRRIYVFLAFVWIFATTGPFAQVPRRSFLFKDARGDVAIARARGDKEVTLIIAAMPGANASLAKTIIAMGGTIRFRDDDVDYLRARVPIDSVEKIVRDPGLHSLEVTTSGTGRGFGGMLGSESAATSSRLSEPKPTGPQETAQRVWPPVPSAYPLTNPYNPLADMGALEFRKAHPTYDGRGVTIACIDGNPDPLLPELQAATTLDGKPVPKIAAYETALDIDEENNDSRWLRMADTVVSADSRFTYQGRTYTAPHSGTYRIALLDESKYNTFTGDGVNGDLNRDGNPPGSSRLFAVLWDEQTNDVWVDTNQNLSFADEKALTDFRTRPEFGVFGTDNPSTPVRESVGFGVQIDRAKRLVAINAGVASHASMIIGSVLASRGTNGRFEGVAPGARLASVSEGEAAYGQTEAVIQAIKNPLVDVAFLEQNQGITRSYLLRDGRMVITLIYSRLIEKYKKPIVIPDANYPVLNGVDDFVHANGALGIGGHESRDSFFINHGVRVEHQDNLLITGGCGPLGDGMLKPDIISPSEILSTNRAWQNGMVQAGLFRLPPGYSVVGGTSTATPTATGAVAMLISAAKQAGVKCDAFRIRHALTMSARFIDHIEAYKQGNGVVNVGAAWEILKALNGVNEMVTITCKAPVRHAYSHLLPTPNEGVGLYEREGWSVGDRGERTVTFTRSSGPKEPVTFALSFTGNDGAFSAPPSVTLPLNTPVSISVAVAPSAPGVHSALLTLDSPSVPGHAYRTLVTVVAAEPLAPSNNFTIEKKTEVPRPSMRSFFYRLPEGAASLRVELDAPKRPVALAVIRPDTRTAPGARIVAARTGRGGGGGGQGAAGEKVTYIVSDPMPGVWEVRLTDVDDTRIFDAEQAEKTEPVPPTPATLTVSTLAAEVTVLDEGVAFVPPGPRAASPTQDLLITNRMAPFTGSVASIPAGSARRASFEIREKEQQVFDVEVLPGSTALVARALKPSDPGADLDVYVFDGTGERVRAAGVDGDLMGDETVIVKNPAAGKWKIVVDAPTVPSGNTKYEYQDIVFNSLYGSVGIADLPQERGAGARWTAKAHVWISAAARASGREPYAALLVQGQTKEGDTYLVSLSEMTARPGANARPDQK